MISKRITACLAVILLVGLGCSSISSLLKPKGEKTAAQLAEDGREAFSDGNYQRAIDAYAKLKDWYPFSRFAKEAELKVADSHYHLKEYEQAITAYEQFERLHPNDEKIPYVIYQTGLCYFDRMKSVDRDQTCTEKALQVFRRLYNRFPSSKYAKKAECHMQKCFRNLAGHEFYVGEFYFKQGHYKAAMARFENVLHEYPEDFLFLRYKADKYMKTCRKELELRAEREEQERLARKLSWLEKVRKSFLDAIAMVW